MALLARQAPGPTDRPEKWSERGDSNSRLRAPKARRLPLTYSPMARATARVGSQ